MTETPKRTPKPHRNAVSRIDFYPDDWLGGTSEMTAEQRGVFITICAKYWSKEGYLRDDDYVMAGECRMSTRRWRQIKAELIALEKIDIQDGFIVQERAELELSRSVLALETRTERASKGGRKKSEKRRKLLEKYGSGSAVSTSTSTEQEGAQEENNTGKTAAQNVPRARVPSPSPYSPLNSPKGTSGFSPDQIQHIARLRSMMLKEFWLPTWGDRPTVEEAEAALRRMGAMRPEDERPPSEPAPPPAEPEPVAVDPEPEPAPATEPPKRRARFAEPEDLSGPMPEFLRRERWS